MKAFMSERETEWFGAPLPQVANVLALGAEQEARRILTETEPRTSQSNYYAIPAALWPRTLPRPSVNGELVERVALYRSAETDHYALLTARPEAQALAEALAAFVALEIS